MTRTVLPAGSFKRQPMGICVASTSRERVIGPLVSVSIVARPSYELDGSRDGPRLNRPARLQILRDTRLASRGSGIAQDDKSSKDFPKTTSYSVDTVSCWPLSAACSVCQASVAHLTRTGNSETPENAASLPRLSPPFDSVCPVTSL